MSVVDAESPTPKTSRAKPRKSRAQKRTQNNIDRSAPSGHAGSMREQLSANLKSTSALRRVALQDPLHYVEVPALEGQVCAFQLAPKSPPILLETISGRM